MLFCGRVEVICDEEDDKLVCEEVHIIFVFEIIELLGMIIAH